MIRHSFAEVIHVGLADLARSWGQRRGVADCSSKWRGGGGGSSVCGRGGQVGGDMNLLRLKGLTNHLLLSG